MERCNDVELDSVAVKQESVYERLLKSVNLQPYNCPIKLDEFADVDKISDTSESERLTGAISVLLSLLDEGGENYDKIDKHLIDQLIATIDEKIGEQLDEILHNKDFQELESTWRGLRFLIGRTDFTQNIKIELLDAQKSEVIEDMVESIDLTQSSLYNWTYTQEYDTPGGEPYSAIISSYDFGNNAQDLSFLRNISKISASCHMPFIGAVNSNFFGKKSMEDVANIKDINSFFQKAEYIKWNNFRKDEDSRYIGLVLPRFLSRLPYSNKDNPIKGFSYNESVKGNEHDKYLWSNASFAFASNLVNSFAASGWCVQIRGPQSGGIVEDLPIHVYDLGTGNEIKIPTEILIPETREFDFSNLGFIPLSFYKNKDYACFFSANSVQEPELFASAEANANSKINTKLPYIFLSSRLAHYLKVLQRENIGVTKDRKKLEHELNSWIQNLVTEMNSPSEELMSTHPLKKALIQVEDIPDNPGFYRVKMYVSPHFQVEGLDINLSLVSHLPKEKE